MANGKRFFVSYAHKDLDSERLLAELQSRLTREGHTVLDDTELILGTNWAQDLVRWVRSCDVLLVLVTKKSLASPYVQAEVAAAHAEQQRSGWPRILPIRVRQRREPKGELKTILSSAQWFDWEGRADTLSLVYRIDEAVRPFPPRPPFEDEPLPEATISKPAAAIPPRARKWSIRAAIALATLAVFWLLASAIIGSRAKTLLASKSRYDVDRGLVLSALSAAMRMSDVPAEVRNRYEREHYAALLATIPSRTMSMSGRDLAVSPEPSITIASGKLLFACDGAFRRCARMEDMSYTRTVPQQTAFLSDTRVVMRDVRGLVLRRDVRNPSEAKRIATRSTALAVESGEIAVAFADAPYVTLYDRDGVPHSPPAEIGPVQQVALGPCSDCVTALGGDGRVWIWARNPALQPLETMGRAIAIASTAYGGRLAVLLGDGTIHFHGAGRDHIPSVVATGQDTEEVTDMKIAEDGNDVALLRNGEVLLVNSSGVTPVIDSVLGPVPDAIAFARKVLVTRSPGEIRVWSRDRALLRQKSAPAKWRHWRQQLGLSLSDLGAAPGDPH